MAPNDNAHHESADNEEEHAPQDSTLPLGEMLTDDTLVGSASVHRGLFSEATSVGGPQVSYDNDLRHFLYNINHLITDMRHTQKEIDALKADTRELLAEFDVE